MQLPFRNPNQLLSKKLPDAPSPSCLQCHEPMADVRPIHIEPTVAASFLIRCLVRCTGCGAAHIGTRTVAVTKGKTRYLHQDFERYSEDEHGPVLQQMKAKIQLKRNRFDRIQAKPVS